VCYQAAGNDNRNITDFNSRRKAGREAAFRMCRGSAFHALPRVTWQTERRTDRFAAAYTAFVKLTLWSALTSCAVLRSKVRSEGHHYWWGLDTQFAKIHEWLVIYSLNFLTIVHILRTYVARKVIIYLCSGLYVQEWKVAESSNYVHNFPTHNISSRNH